MHTPPLIPTNCFTRLSSAPIFNTNYAKSPTIHNQIRNPRNYYAAKLRLNNEAYYKHQLKPRKFYRNISNHKRLTELTTNLINKQIILDIALIRMINLRQINLIIKDQFGQYTFEPFTTQTLPFLLKQLAKLPQLQTIDIEVDAVIKECSLKQLFKWLQKVKCQRSFFVQKSSNVARPININLSLYFILTINDLKQIKHIQNLTQLRIINILVTFSFKKCLSSDNYFPPKLEYLHLANFGYPFKNADLQNICALKKLKGFSTDGNDLSACNLIHFNQLQLSKLHLRSANLRSGQVADYIDNLSDKTQLKDVSLEYNKGLSSLDFQALAQLPNLQYLDLSNTQFNSADFKYLAQHAKSTNTLQLLTVIECPLAHQMDQVLDLNQYFPKLKIIANDKSQEYEKKFV